MRGSVKYHLLINGTRFVVSTNSFTERIYFTQQWFSSLLQCPTRRLSSRPRNLSSTSVGYQEQLFMYFNKNIFSSGSKSYFFFILFCFFSNTFFDLLWGRDHGRQWWVWCVVDD